MSAGHDMGTTEFSCGNFGEHLTFVISSGGGKQFSILRGVTWSNPYVFCGLVSRRIIWVKLERQSTPAFGCENLSPSAWSVLLKLGARPRGPPTWTIELDLSAHEV